MAKKRVGSDWLVGVYDTVAEKIIRRGKFRRTAPASGHIKIFYGFGGSIELVTPEGHVSFEDNLIIKFRDPETHEWLRYWEVELH